MENYFSIINIYLLVTIICANVFSPIFVIWSEKEYKKYTDDNNKYWRTSKLNRLEWMTVVLASTGGYFTSLWTARQINYKKKDERSRFYVRLRTSKITSIIFILCTFAFVIATKL